MSEPMRRGNAVIFKGYEYAFDTELQAIQFESCIKYERTVDACLDLLPQNCWSRKKKNGLNLG